MDQSKICLLLILLAGWFAGCSNQSELRWIKEDGYRWAEVDPGFWGETGLEALDAGETGISFQNLLSDSLMGQNQVLLNGSGVAAGDINGDGRADLYFASLEGPNRLYENMGGHHFKDITKSAGVAHQGFYSTGTVFADVDGDGDLDLLVASLNKENVLYLNDGAGHFTESTDSGLGVSHGATTMTLADIDQDGDLDLYIANYKKKAADDIFSPEQVTWEKTTIKDGDHWKLKPKFKKYYILIQQKGNAPQRFEKGEQDELYLNNGKGKFKRISDLKKHFLDEQGEPLGLQPYWGLTAKFHDLNGDGKPDLYVCNDNWTPDRVWINQGNGIFRKLGARGIRNFTYSSMAVDFSDIDRDGNADIFVTGMQSPLHRRRLRQMVQKEPFAMGPGIINNQPQYNQNSLYLNRGDTTFAEISNYAGVEATGWSWATKFLDVDLDGYEDLLINTGNLKDVQDLDTQGRISREVTSGRFTGKYILSFPSLKLPNKVYKNNGDWTFSDNSKDWGFDQTDVSQGLATADFDRDGDLDIAINRLNQPSLIYENTSDAPRIGIQLKGKAPNTQAIGSKITLTGGKIKQQKEIESGGDYASGSSPQVMFAARGDENQSYTLSIIWPDGSHSEINQVKRNRIYEINQVEVDTRHRRAGNSNKSDQPWFKDVSDRVPYLHHEDPYDDFKIQPLLPRRLSLQGPGVAWIDYDQDGDDDLFISSGKGGPTGIFRNQGNGQFISASLSQIQHEAPGDQTAIIGWNDGSASQIIFGSANLEQGNSKVPSAYNYTIQDDGKVSRNALPGALSTTGPVAAADYDGDGDIDLFIGGRFIPGNYPLAATSRLFKNNNGNWIPDASNNKAFRRLGMVTSAVFVDYDNDHDQDLICTLEWGPIKIFRNDKGRFHDATKELGFDQYYGWWNGVATGDFNNDGRMDIVATNQGLNSPYHASSEQPLKMYYGDFNNDKRIDILESYFDPDLNGYVPRRRAYAFQSVPAVTRKSQTNRDFARSTLKDLMGDFIDNAPFKGINRLQSMIFFNNDSGFDARALPKRAQLSPGFYAGVADIDNDGNEDLFMSQNFFAVRPLSPRQDAGRGLWLKGDGEGDFQAISGNKSGIKVYGAQRGGALGDFNRDGRVDLAVSQNAAVVKLYLNQTKKRGYRIRLIGPDGNKNAIGSSIRMIYNDGSKGPRRVIQAGSGYGSQNSFTEVMGYARDAKQIEVTWFDGRIQKVDCTVPNHTYTINYLSAK